MNFLVAAYAVLWAISFGLVFSMVWRQRKIESEMQTLHVLIDDQPRLVDDEPRAEQEW